MYVKRFSIYNTTGKYQFTSFLPTLTHISFLIDYESIFVSAAFFTLEDVIKSLKYKTSHKPIISTVCFPLLCNIRVFYRALFCASHLHKPLIDPAFNYCVTHTFLKVAKWKTNIFCWVRLHCSFSLKNE